MVVTSSHQPGYGEIFVTQDTHSVWVIVQTIQAIIYYIRDLRLASSRSPNVKSHTGVRFESLGSFSTDGSTSQQTPDVLPHFLSLGGARSLLIAKGAKRL